MTKYKKIFSYFGTYKKTVLAILLTTTLQVIGNSSLPYIMSLIIDNGIGSQDVRYVFTMGGLMLAVTAATCAVGIITKKMVATASSGLGDNIRREMAEQLCTFSSRDITRFSKASFINRMTVDVSNIQGMVDITLGIVLSAPITVACIIIMSYNIDKSLSAIFLTAVPLFAVTAFIIVKMSLPYYANKATSQDDMNRSLLEDLVSIRLVKAFVRESFMLAGYKKEAKKVNEYGQTAEQITNLNNPVGTLIANLCIVLLLWYGGQKIIGGKIEVGQLFTFVTYTNQILYQITLISMMIVPVVSSVVSINRVLEVLEAQPSVKDEYEDASIESKDGSLKLEHVWFDYNPECKKEDMLLQNWNLEIRDREAIGIVGATGAGKTTLVNLIPRLFDVVDGTITLGGCNIREIPLSTLRRTVSFAPQRSLLFSGTLRENLQCGCPDATDEEMKKALENACILKEVMSHDEGLNMKIEEGGNNVSGGQRQRLCLARAFLKKSRLLVMDDCTSALDKATERAVMDYIVHGCTDRTRILISGKISSIKQMDRIIVMDKGHISAIGTHEELIKTNNIYRDLCQSQGELEDRGLNR